MSETVSTPCPSHAGMAATDTCQRCGSFTCVLCQQQNPRLCPKCAGRYTAFLFNRGNLDIVDLLSATWSNVFKPHWIELSLAAFVAFAVPGVASYIFQIPNFILASNGIEAPAQLGMSLLLMLMAVVVQLVLQLVFQRGLIEMAHSAWNGQKPAFGALFNFKAGLKAFVAFLLAFMLPVAAWGLGGVAAVTFFAASKSTGLLVMAAGLGIATYTALIIWLLPAYLLCQPFAENPDVGILEGIRLCFERGRGFRLKIFLAGLISVPIILLGFMACGIGIFPAMGLIFAYQTGFWKALSTSGSSSLPQ